MALVSNAAASREDELRRLMPPPAPRPPTAVVAPKPKPAVVLDEDTYTQQLEGIIERDYFPELPKMANQLEWLRAVNSGDIREMQRAQRNIARRRAAATTPAAGMAATPSLGGETPGMPQPFATPGTAGGWGASTPGTALLRTPAMTPMVGAAGGPPDAAAAGGATAATTAVPSGPAAAGMSLDSFLATYTSEDNASFQAILEEDNRRKRAKVKHHLERPDPRDPETRQLLLEGPKDRPSDEYGTTGQAPMTLLPAPEPVVNTLFYDSSQRPAVPFSAKELGDQALGPPKAINKAGTRLKAPPEEVPASAANAAMAAALAAVVVGSAAAAAGLPIGAPLPAAAGGGTMGYAPMATPALDDVLASPLMTWGDIESTPLRLGADDMPVTLDLEALVGGGPAFRVQGLTEREQAAHKLAAAKAGSGSAASRATGARGSTPLLAALRRATTGTGGGAGATARNGGGGGTPLAVPLSPAARQLAANIKAASMTPRGAGAAAVATSTTSGSRGGYNHNHNHYNHRTGGGSGNYHNAHHRNHRGGGGPRESNWRGPGFGGRGGTAGSAAAAAAAAAATATAARSSALGCGELDKQLQASYRSGSTAAGRGGEGTPAAGAGLTRGHTPGVGVGAATAAAVASGSRRMPVVVGVKRTPSGATTAPVAGGEAAAAPTGPAGGGGSGRESVTDDLLKL